MMRSFFTIISFFSISILFTQSRITKETIEQWYADRTKWYPEQQFLHEYDADGNQVFTFESTRKSGEAVLSDFSITRRDFDKNGNELSSIREERVFGNFYEIKKAVYQTFNEQNQLTTRITEGTHDDLSSIFKDYYETKSEYFYDSQGCLTETKYKSFTNGILSFLGPDNVIYFSDENCRLERKEFYSQGTLTAWENYLYENPNRQIIYRAQYDLDLEIIDTAYVKIYEFDEFENRTYYYYRSFKTNYEREIFFKYDDKNRQTSSIQLITSGPFEELTFLRHDSTHYVENENDWLIKEEKYSLSESGETLETRTVFYEYYCDGSLKIKTEEDLNNSFTKRTAYEYDKIIPCEIKNVSPFQIEVSPNPVNNFLSIILPDLEFETVKIDIISLNGNIVLTQNISSPQKQILLRIDNIPQGMYILSANDGTETVSRKIVIRL